MGTPLTRLETIFHGHRLREPPGLSLYKMATTSCNGKIPAVPTIS